MELSDSGPETAGERDIGNWGAEVPGLIKQGREPVTAWFRRLWPGRRPPVKRALALAGGGVIGGMYEVGALTALDEALPGFRTNDFDIFVGTSSGSVVASIMANGITPAELYRVLDLELPDPMNLQKNDVFDGRAVRRAARNLGRLIWAVGKQFLTGFRFSIPDILSKVQESLPPGFFSLEQVEVFMRRLFEAKGLSNDFRTIPRTLLIPAVDLDRAERVVFGLGPLAEVPISHAIAASSAIPGFFEPYTVGGRDYVDGGVGHVAHADAAIELGAEVVVVINPQVPLIEREGNGQKHLKARGLYSVLEQSSRITSQSLLEMGLRELQARHPKVEIFLIQPDPGEPLLFGPSMGFASSRPALRYGYTSTKAWLDGAGTTFRRRFSVGPALRLPVRSSA